MPAATRSWESQRMHFALSAWEHWLCWYLDFSPVVLILHFCYPKLWENKFLLFWVTKFLVICCNSHRKLIYMPTWVQLCPVTPAFLGQAGCSMPAGHPPGTGHCRLLCACWPSSWVLDAAGCSMPVGHSLWCWTALTLWNALAVWKTPANVARRGVSSFVGNSCLLLMP